MDFSFGLWHLKFVVGTKTIYSNVTFHMTIYYTLEQVKDHSILFLQHFLSYIIKHCLIKSLSAEKNQKKLILGNTERECISCNAVFELIFTKMSSKTNCRYMISNRNVIYSCINSMENIRSFIH